MNKKKDKKPTNQSKTMNFPLPQEEFEKYMKSKISEVKEEINVLENVDASNIIYIDFKTKKRLI